MKKIEKLSKTINMNDMFQRIKVFGKKENRGSLYSMVSCSDLTPGSVEIWLDLPDEIKYDPLLAPFKQRYEQQHGEFKNQFI